MLAHRSKSAAILKAWLRPLTGPMTFCTVQRWVELPASAACTPMLLCSHAGGRSPQAAGQRSGCARHGRRRRAEDRSPGGGSGGDAQRGEPAGGRAGGGAGERQAGCSRPAAGVGVAWPRGLTGVGGASTWKLIQLLNCLANSIAVQEDKRRRCADNPCQIKPSSRISRHTGLL